MEVVSRGSKKWIAGKFMLWGSFERRVLWQIKSLNQQHKFFYFEFNLSSKDAQSLFNEFFSKNLPLFSRQILSQIQRVFLISREGIKPKKLLNFLINVVLICQGSLFAIY